ncbi:hypothetical protein Sta7437_1838 [Stanieria cyanosphaera PCC 7437]|uniref:Uncharacterized protein n=1 Tax=Stanieria cyanosphaera (strain ATCC 29371 / PCC 7437) TaxID=111780 RepID=K9XTI9_STAC7|nr:hypothetical protein [Stanieria cyanosphaera]AFZ35396.1 hypothetical protein Sta7437_1838 [Stanieria cyanosphaera PCC 7437]
MLIPNKLTQLTTILGLGISLTLVTAIAQSSLAQSNNPANEGYQSNEESPFLGSGNGGFNPLELIHRANLSNGRSLNEFNQDSENNIKNSASEFKRLQQERLLQQQQSESTPEKPMPSN